MLAQTEVLCNSRTLLCKNRIFVCLTKENFIINDDITEFRNIVMYTEEISLFPIP
jgi:hypothetical protein